VAIFPMIYMQIEQLLYQLYSDPVLQEDDRNFKLFSNTYSLFMNKEKGSFFTNPTYAKKLTEICFNYINTINYGNFRVLDPACGLGEFLIAAANQILKKNFSDKLRSKTEQTIERQKIISNCLFGYDIDEKTVELCKLRLYLWSLLPIFTDQKIPLNEIKRKSADIPWNITQANYFDKIHTTNKYDLILCNPPYNGEISDNNQHLLQNLFPEIIRNSAAYFFLLCDYMLEELGTMGFILPKSMAYSKRWSSLKNRVLENLIYAHDISKAFRRVNLEQLMLVVSRNSYNRKYITLSEENTHITIEKNKELVQNSLILNLSENDYFLYKKMQSYKYSLENFVSAHRGLNIQTMAENATKMNTNYLYCIEGKLIGQFHLKPIQRVISKRRIKKIEVCGEIVGQLANAHVKYPNPHYKLVFSQRPSIKYIPFDTVLTIHPLMHTNDIPNDWFVAYLLCYLNSKLFAWYLYKIVYAGAIRSTRLDFVYLKQVPFLPIHKNEEKIYLLFLFLSSSLSYLSYRKSDPNLFDRLVTIMNFMVIHLYLLKAELDQWIQSITINWEDIYNISKEVSSEISDAIEKKPCLDISPSDFSNRNEIIKIHNFVNEIWNSKFSKKLDNIKNEKLLQLLV